MRQWNNLQSKAKQNQRNTLGIIQGAATKKGKLGFVLMDLKRKGAL